MKIWELEVDKIYISAPYEGGREYRYKINHDSNLFYLTNNNVWVTASLNYNKVVKMDFFECAAIDWSNIKKGTKVQVSDDEEYWENRYFVYYNENVRYLYITTRVLPDEFSEVNWNYASQGYKYCRLYEENQN